MKMALAVLLVCAAAVPVFAAAPAWDHSGNGLLSGTYYFREVVYQTDGAGNTSRAIALFGNITFNASNGTYSLVNGAGASTLTVNDSLGGFSVPSGGTYSVSASGFGFMQDPASSLASNAIFLVSNHILVGSATENGRNTMIVAAPVAGLSNSSFSGAYTISGFFPGINYAGAVDATYQLSPNGGSLGTVGITGFTAAGATLSQSAAGVKYAVSNGLNTITFPTNANAVFYAGPVYMYLSPDSNFVFGGSAGGYDMFVGVKNLPSGTNTPLSGLYYAAGLDENEVTALDSYYGTLNAFQGNIIGHERMLYSGSGGALGEGYTYYGTYPASIANTYQDASGTTQYTVGADGIRIGFGIGVAGTNRGYPSIQAALPFTPPSPSGSVYIDPTGVVNTASSAPYTAGVSPGDFITLYNGVNLASSTVYAAPGAFPPTLGNVQVLITGVNGVTDAPLYYVSANQISFLMPYGVTPDSIVSIKVVNNNVSSNTVTTYVYPSTPGAFTASPVGGDGIAAMLDFPPSGGYYVVSADQPANPGDPVALYVTGLGAPFPSNADGALGPAVGDTLINSVEVQIGGINVGNLAYQGLAPDLAGLYQLNFTMPALCGSAAAQPCINSGNNLVGIMSVAGSGAVASYSEEAYVPVGAGGSSAGAAVTSRQTEKILPRLSPSSRR